MSLEERKQLFKVAADGIGTRVPKMATTGCHSLSKTLELTQYAVDLGYESILLITPHYLQPGREATMDYYPYGWPDVGDLTAGDMFSIAWRCLDAQLCGVAQRRKRIFLLADFAGPLAPQLLFDVFDETENSGKEVS